MLVNWGAIVTLLVPKLGRGKLPTKNNKVALNMYKTSPNYWSKNKNVNFLLFVFVTLVL